MMDASVNPNPNADESSALVNAMTATFDTVNDLRVAVADLNRMGLGADHISVFFGKEGYEGLDPLGTQQSLGMRVVRALQLFAGEEKALRDAADTLQDGNAILRVLTDGTADQKKTVEVVLKTHNAHNIHFVGRWAVEHLSQ